MKTPPTVQFSSFLLCLFLTFQATAQTPVISSVSPAVGIPGSTTVTITGSGFNTTPANNIVYFGATRATVTSASATTLGVTVPVGATHMPVTVNNSASSLMGYSQYPFLPTFDNSGYATGTVNFDAHVSLMSPSLPWRVALADIDGDGKPDLVTVHDNGFSVYRNESVAGVIDPLSFPSRQDFEIAPGFDGIETLAVGDINGDGKPDVVVGKHEGTIYIFENTATGGSISSGSFASPVTFLFGFPFLHTIYAMTIGDVDADGNADIVTAGAEMLGVYRGTGATGSITISSLSFPEVYGSFGTAVSVVLTDVDGDGLPDAVVGNVEAFVGNLSIYRNISSPGTVTGAFAAPVNYAAGSYPIFIAAGDMDGDGKTDLIVADHENGRTGIFRNTSSAGSITSGSLDTMVDFETPVGPTEMSIADFDGDGKPDIAVACNAGNVVSIFRNTATSGVINSSSLAARVDSATGTGTVSVAAGDIDGDGLADIVAANRTANNISVLRNNPILSSSSISGTLTLCVGDTSALTGTPSGGTWISSNTSVATVNISTGVVSGVSTGTATISYTISGASTTAVVSVLALPDAGSITGSSSVCAGGMVSLSNGVAGGDWTSSNTSVATIGTTGMVTSLASGTSTISYTVTGTCGTASSILELTVNVVPTAITGTATLCEGAITTLSCSPGSGTWTSGNVSVATVDVAGIVAGVGAGTASISYTLGSGCQVKREVTVSAGPTAITGTLSSCVGSNTALGSTPSGGTWSSSNTAKATINSSTGVVTAVSAGTATITYALSAGCYRAATFTILNNPGAIGGTAALCEGAATTLSCSPGGGTWSSSDPSIATIGTTGVVSSVSAGNTTISYVTGTGCAATRVLTVNTLPDAISGTTMVCVGGTTTLGSAPGGGTWTSYFASRASVNAATGVVTGMSPGTSIITYSLAGGCRRTTIVTVAAAPAAITGSLSLCVGSTTDLNCGTTGGTWSAVTAAVATINSSTGLLSGIGTGTSIISYITGSGCARTAIVTVSISGSTITGDAVVCVGQTNGTLSSGMTGGTWASSNTTIATVHAASGLLTGIGAGNANITYTRTPGCYNIIEATVNAAVGTITGATSVAAGATTTLTSSTGGGAWSSTNTLKATVNAATGEVTGVTAGTTTISYLVSTGCYRARTMVITATRPGISSEADAALTVLKVYPNPTAGKITIEAPVSGTFTVYTIEGRQVVHYPVTTATTTVSLPQNIATGVYLCRFDGEDGSTAMVRLVYEQ